MELKNMGDKVVIGTMLSEFYVPNIVKIFRACGFEYIIIDCEHGYFDYISVANITSVARACGIFTIVRISQPEREAVQKYLDMGVGGILLAMTETPEQVRQLVSYCKYPPMGKRGISLQRAHTDYCPGKVEEYIRQANKETIALAQIESRLGVSNSKKIAAVDGMDGLMIGPNDLSMDNGCVGQYDFPAVVSNIEEIINAAGACNKLCGLISSNIPLLTKWVKTGGLKLLSWNSEVGMMLNEGKRGLAQLKADL